MFKNFTIDAHPMAIMVAVVGALSSIFSELDPSNPEHRWLACTRRGLLSSGFHKSRQTIKGLSALPLGFVGKPRSKFRS
eukprot:4694109-Amphidinium_carterae.1